MKLILALVLILSSFAFASTGEERNLLINGAQPTLDALLKGEQTHTEYRIEQRPATCYRTEIVGYRTVCSGGGYPGPYPRPNPRPYPPGNCWQEPIYRRIAYSCMQTVRIPYEVKDYDVDAKVMIHIVNNNNVDANEMLKVTLLGDQLTLSLKGSGRFLVSKISEHVNRNMRGNVMMIDAHYSVELVKFENAINLTNIGLDEANLSFIYKGGRSSNLGIKLYAVKKKIGSDIVLFNRELAASEYGLLNRGSETEASVNIENLGINMTSGKYSYTATVFYKLNGELMNADQFEGKLEGSRTLLYSIR